MKTKIAKCAEITGAKLYVTHFRGEPVISTAVLSDLFHVNEDRIRGIARANRHLLIPDVDFYRLTGDDLREYKMACDIPFDCDVESLSPVVSRSASMLTVWTANGVLALAMLLGGDAHFIQRDLKTAYFGG